MYVELVGDDTTIEMAHFCRLETVCDAGQRCKDGEPDLSGAERDTARACAQASRTCGEYRRCWQPEPTSKPIVLDADSPASICEAQSACFGDDRAECLSFLRENPMRPTERTRLRRCAGQPRSCAELKTCLALEELPGEPNAKRNDAPFHSVRFQRWWISSRLPALAARNPEAAKTLEECLEVSQGEALCLKPSCAPTTRRHQWLGTHVRRVAAANSAWSNEFGGAPTVCRVRYPIVQFLSIRDAICACSDAGCVRRHAVELERLDERNRNREFDTWELDVVKREGDEIIQCVERIMKRR